ncbi:hypothetical protein [Flammeovirga sp. SubArs3]|uniref:hypothetical protein n=1 Tax=Flammeovirga sp. SubArs3 TaxID=2995316 RepID=UPI00248D01FF|nr:hypothetical protein [Flammeovirga sp. SubArs3]
MKKQILLAVAFLATMMVSCSTEDTDTPSPAAESVDLQVNVSNSALSNARIAGIENLTWIDQSLITMTVNGADWSSNWTPPSSDGSTGGTLADVPFGVTDFEATYIDPRNQNNQWRAMVKAEDGSSAEDAMNEARALRNPFVDYIGEQNQEVNSTTELDEFSMVAQQGRITVGLALEDQAAGKFYALQANFQIKRADGTVIYNQGGWTDYAYNPMRYGWGIDFSDRQLTDDTFVSIDVRIWEVSAEVTPGQNFQKVDGGIEHRFHFDGDPNAAQPSTHNGMRLYGLESLMAENGIAKGLAITFDESFTPTITTFTGLTFDFAPLTEEQTEVIEIQ